MDPHVEIQRFLNSARADDPAYWPIFFDFLEDNNWGPGLLDTAVRKLVTLTSDQQGEQVSVAPREVWAKLLHELAKTSYPSAVEVMNHVRIARRARNRGTWDKHRTWENFLLLQKMEQVTGEYNGDLGPWEKLVDDEGRETRRPYVVDFALEYLQRELENEYGHNAQFKTVYAENAREHATLRDSQGIWRLIRSFNAGGEPDCPYLGFDEGNEVTLEQTYCGENPGKQCSLCEEEIGEQHSHIYIGEIGGNIYMLDVMAAVSVVEIQEQDDGYWHVLGFGPDNIEVDLPLNRNSFRTQVEAESAARFIPGSSGVEIVVVPLEDSPEG